MDNYEQEQAAIAIEELVESIISEITGGTYDEYLKRLARAIFDRKDVIDGTDSKPKEVSKPKVNKPKVNIDAASQNIQHPNDAGSASISVTPQYKKNKATYSHKGNFTPTGITAKDQTVTDGTFTLPPATNRIPKLPDNTILDTVDGGYFFYKRVPYSKKMVKGLDIVIPSTVSIPELANLRCKITGVGNANIKVELLEPPTTFGAIAEAWSNKTPVFLPLDYISNLLEQ